MRHTKSFSLNDNNEVHRAILERLDQEPSVSSVTIQALYDYYFGEHGVEADNSEILRAIAELKSIIEATPKQQPDDVTRRDPTKEPIEDDLELSPVLIAGLKRVAGGRPGMRLES